MTLPYLILCYDLVLYLLFAVLSFSSHVVLAWCAYVQDLDLTKPGVRKPMKRPEFEVTSAEVLRKADFRVSIFGSCISSLANILLPIYIWSSVLNCGIRNS